MMVKKTPDSLDSQKPVGESNFWQNVPHRQMTPVSCSPEAGYNLVLTKQNDAIYIGLTRLDSHKE
jgi:hypothetical protein